MLAMTIVHGVAFPYFIAAILSVELLIAVMVLFVMSFSFRLV